MGLSDRLQTRIGETENIANQANYLLTVATTILIAMGYNILTAHTNPGFDTEQAVAILAAFGVLWALGFTAKMVQRWMDAQVLNAARSRDLKEMELRFAHELSLAKVGAKPSKVFEEMTKEQLMQEIKRLNGTE